MAWWKREIYFFASTYHLIAFGTRADFRWCEDTAFGHRYIQLSVHINSLDRRKFSFGVTDGSIIWNTSLFIQKLFFICWELFRGKFQPLSFSTIHLGVNPMHEERQAPHKLMCYWKKWTKVSPRNSDGPKLFHMPHWEVAFLETIS